MSDNEQVIAAYATGSAGFAKVDKAMDQAWAEILADPKSLKRAAKILDLPVAKIPKKSPYSARPDHAGIGAVETAILIVAFDFVRDVGYDFLKDAAKESVKDGLKILWNLLVKERAEEHLPDDAFGAERPVPDDVQ